MVLGGTGFAAVGFGGENEAPGARSTLPPASAAVERTTLVETEKLPGTLGYGTTYDLNAAGGGTLTALAAEGRTVTRGQTVFKVDTDPVPLLYGKLPLYRTLSAGVEGPDVLQFEQNLRDLGYTGFTVDKEYSAATADAVLDWQEDLGVEETGTIERGAVVIARGAIRVAEHKKVVGDPASGPLLTYTGTRRVVTVDLEVGYQNLVKKGRKVTVETPAGDSVDGRIVKIGSVATQPKDEETEATIEVTISLSNDKGFGGLDEAPVDVHFTSDERRDVLAVPVGALLALGGGGYAVQVVDGATARTVQVETGMFADGMVEVTGNGLSEGMKVGIPK
ncbi:multidrug efflux pump subunit AcrA (membrane-fusion protein) [Thermomonospora umbrina]|uniref:Multidrug efflux pump subunit AcrA (Membrane-fusion protein) n=1 Tax=Thermomonospora umbrina TaxID=111806 RepID=A0A3D9SGE8_9ACTN|nr:multidrug efflux pump subunit AcrA (membrane-fusion protein) [Thermomonospora umbrina]